MEKIIEAILKYNPFGSFFKKLGLSDDLSALFSVILIVLLVTGLVQFCKHLYNRYKFERDALENINPQFDHLSIKKAKQFYIQTQYQNASPARQEEPGFTHKYIARNKLIPFFIKTAFNEKVDSERFFLILADSGMGKTTFMVNLYLRYNSIYNYSRKYSMKLLRFSNIDTIQEIKSIKSEEAKRTILLLDALDEDLGIISTDPNVSDAQAFQNRIDEIIELTKNYREVVITCRTQYFPGQEDDPYELKIKRPDEKGFYILNKIYISPFNEKEVRRYLNKKFGVIPFINSKKKKAAHKIVSQSTNLIMRPMLLSYIDYLIEEEVSERTTYSIYETLVLKWLQREAEKRKGLADRKKFITDLRMLSVRTAINIYLNWRKEGRMFLSKEETIKIAEEFKIELKPEEITGQSLLTCDGVGNWKFAHKSILEYFLAKEAIANIKFLRVMNFKGMDMARKFYGELQPLLLFIDNSIITDVRMPDSCKTLQDYFIYDRPVDHQDMKVGFALQNTALHRSQFQRVSFKDAISYCNEMNRLFVYPEVYDDQFNFMDKNGNKVTNIDEVRGFRLPTVCELQIYFSHRPYWVLLSYLEATKIPVKDLREIKRVFDTRINIGNAVVSQKQHEWCYDVTGISAVGISRTTQPTFSPNYNELTYDIQYLSKDTAEDQLASFRLVFIP